MPITVRSFFVFSVLLVGWWMYWTLVTAPMVLAGDPASIGRVWALVILTGGISLLVLGAAALVTYARQSWARWLLVFVFVLSELLPLWVQIAADYRDPGLVPDLRHALLYYIPTYWISPGHSIELTVKILLVLLIFSSSSRAWFNRQEYP